MKVPERKRIFSYFLLVISLGFIFVSFNYDPKSRLIPLVLALVTLLLLVCVVINEIRPVPFLERLNRDLTEIYRTKSSPVKTDSEAAGRKFFVFLGWVSGFFLSILFFGFNISITLFAFVFFKTEARLGWAKSLVTAGLIWGAVFAVFELALDFVLFKGFLFGEVLPPL